MVCFAYGDGRLGHIHNFGALTTYSWRDHYNGYPADAISAPDDGVWVIGEEDVEHYTERGKVEEHALPAQLRDISRGMTAVMSPCGVLWFRQSTDNKSSILSSWRVTGVTKKGCIDGSTVH